MYHFEATKTAIHRLDRNSLADIRRDHRKSFAASFIETEKEQEGRNASFSGLAIDIDQSLLQHCGFVR